jgi:hypothetical protein
MRRINDLPIRVGKMVCKMDFMVVDIDRYDVLLGLYFFVKIGTIVEIECQFIQIHHELESNVQVLPLNMVNMCQKMNNNLGFEF